MDLRIRPRNMTLLRGRGLGLEVALVDRDIDEALTELEERLDERRDFYRGTAATAAFGKRIPSAEQLGRLRTLLEGAGIALCALSGDAEVARVAADAGLTFVERLEPNGETVARRRALRERPDGALSESAKSLIADFAGARADIAQRRKRGEQSVRPLVLGNVQSAVPSSPLTLQSVETPPQTLYHVGTLRGGQALHNVGNLVVVGDVNPGAELVASGDIVVFGRLAGVAHAGAQGDVSSRVYALALRATQLRIATFIAAEAGSATGQPLPEVAFVRNDHIVIEAHDRAQPFPEEKKS